MLLNGNYHILLETHTSSQFGSWGVDGVALVSHFEPDRSEWRFENLPDGKGMSIQSVFTQNYLAPFADSSSDKIASTPHPYAWHVHPTGTGHYLIQSSPHHPPMLNWNPNAHKTYVVLTSHPVEGANAVTWIIKPVEHANHGHEHK